MKILELWAFFLCLFLIVILIYMYEYEIKAIKKTVKEIDVRVEKICEKKEKNGKDEI